MLVVNVSAPILQATGDALIDAVAQIVFTATELNGVSGVRLLVDGEQREWPRGDGSQTAAPLTRFDYPERNPTSQPDYPAVPSPGPVASSTTVAAATSGTTNATTATTSSTHDRHDRGRLTPPVGRRSHPTTVAIGSTRLPWHSAGSRMPKRWQA